MLKRLPFIAAGVAVVAVAAAVIKKISQSEGEPQRPPSALAHLSVGRSWEYEVQPGGATAITTVVASMVLENGQKAFRVEYEKGDSVIDRVYTEDEKGQLLNLSQDDDSVTFFPPLVALGALLVGKSWASSSRLVPADGAPSPVQVESRGQVVKRETVTVPAGTFANAYKVEYATNQTTSTGWHVPGIGLIREVSADEELLLKRLVEPKLRDTSRP